MITEERNTQVEGEVQEEQPKSELEQRLSQVGSDEATSVPKEDKPSEGASPLPTLEELDIPEQQPQAEPTQPSLELPDTEEAKKFAQDFKEYLGFDISELRSGVDELRQAREYIAQQKAQTERQSAMQELSTEWGIPPEEADMRLQAVVERFNKYPPEMRQRLDNLEGAKLIWAKIEQESQASGVPKFQKSTGYSVGQKYQFTKSEIDSMTRDEYYRNQDKITQAYALGLVDTSK